MALVRGEVDPERLLAEQVLPGAEDRRVELLVEVVRNGAVDGLDGLVGEELAVVRDEARARLDPLVPGQHVGVDVADDGELGADADVGEVDPARRGARELAAHQPAADEAEPDRPDTVATSESASSAVASSCTIAISARVIAAGISCWMTLRP